MSTAAKPAPLDIPMIHAGYCDGRPGQHGNKYPGKTQVIDGRHIGVIFHKQSFQELPETDRQTPRIDCNKKYEQKEKPSHSKGKNTPYIFIVLHEVAPSFLSSDAAPDALSPDALFPAVPAPASLSGYSIGCNSFNASG